MSGIYSQIGVVKEIGTPVAITGITATAGSPNIGTVASTAHGYRAGDVITTTGFTPAGWNGTFVIQSVPTANTYVISSGATVVATSTVQGTVTSVTKFGGGGTVSRFFENPQGGESFKYDRGRVVSNAVTAGRLTKRADRFAVYGRGGSGALKLEVLSKGFAYWLELMLGTVVASGPTDTAAYSYTATQGLLLGKSAAVQLGRPTSYGSVQPFSYTGAKVQSWSLDNTVDGILMLTLTFSFQNELVNVALAAPSYPTGAELLTFIGGNIILGGIALATCKTMSIGCNNLLTAVADRRFINAGGLPGEPLQTGWRDITWSAEVEFTDMNAYNRYTSATAAGTMAALSAAWTAPTLITGAAVTFPSFTVTAPNARHDGETPNTDGPNLITLNLSGPLLNTAATADDAITVTYVTGDVTA